MKAYSFADPLSQNNGFYQKWLYQQSYWLSAILIGPDNEAKIIKGKNVNKTVNCCIGIAIGMQTFGLVLVVRLLSILVHPCKQLS